MASETTLLISAGKLNYKTNKQGWTCPSGHLSGCVEIDELLFNAQSLLQHRCRNTVGSVGRMSRLSEAECGSSLHTSSMQCRQAAESHQNPGVTEQGSLLGSFNTWLSAQTGHSSSGEATWGSLLLLQVSSLFEWGWGLSPNGHGTTKSCRPYCIWVLWTGYSKDEFSRQRSNRIWALCSPWQISHCTSSWVSLSLKWG